MQVPEDPNLNSPLGYTIHNVVQGAPQQVFNEISQKIANYAFLLTTLINNNNNNNNKVQSSLLYTLLCTTLLLTSKHHGDNSRPPLTTSRLQLQVCYHFRFFLWRNSPLVGQSLTIIEASPTHSDTPHPLGLLWTSVQQQHDGRPLHLDFFF